MIRNSAESSQEQAKSATGNRNKESGRKEQGSWVAKDQPAIHHSYPLLGCLAVLRLDKHGHAQIHAQVRAMRSRRLLAGTLHLHAGSYTPFSG